MKPSLALQKRRAFLLGAVAIGGSLAGCGSDSSDSPTPAPGDSASPRPPTVPAPCPAVPNPVPITVIVVDATTLDSVSTATGTAAHTDGTTVPLNPDPEIVGQLSGGTKTGYWTVTIRAPGYRDWSIDGVGVPYTTNENPCPQTHRLQANLEK